MMISTALVVLLIAHKKLDTIQCVLLSADGAAVVLVFIKTFVYVLLLLFILPPTVLAFAECFS